MDLLDSVPNEIFLAILNLMHPTSIVALACTSKRNYQVATDDAAWLPIVHQVMAPHVYSPHFTTSILLSRASDILTSITRKEESARNPLFLIYSKHLVQYGWMLGWWFITIEPRDPWQMTEDCLCRIYIDLRIDGAGTIEYSISARRARHPLAILDPLLTAYDARLSITDRTGRDILEINIPGASPLSIDGYGLTDLGASTPIGMVFGGDRALEATWVDPAFSTIKLPTNELASLSLEDPNERHDDAPFPSPSLRPLFIDTQSIPAPTLPASPGDRLEWSSTRSTTSLLRIKSPTSFIDSPTDLLRSGIYIAPFGHHGWEYVLVRIRHLTEEDFVVTWPWEGSFSSTPASRGLHLGPFSDAFQRLSEGEVRVSREHVRPGARILEVVKITGDPNVPKGYRTIVAFLDDPRVSDFNSMELPEEIQVIPGECPWPVLRDPASRTPDSMVETPFCPSRGVDIPGCVRLAWWGFTRPYWASSTVHVESRTQFSAWAHGLGEVMIFTRIGDLVL